MSRFQEFRPSAKYQTQIAINVLLSAVFFVLPFAFLALIPELGLIYLGIFVLANLLWLVPALVLVPLYVRSIRYEFGERELIVRRGIITRSESVVPYTMITNVEAKRGPVARALDIGALKVHTAGYSQQAQSEASLSGLTDWAEVQQHLLALIHQHQQAAEQGAPALAAPAGEAAADQGTQALLREIRDELRLWRSSQSR